VYDPLGLVSPTTLSGKLTFRDISDEKLAWDTELPEQLQKLWNKWYNLPASVTIPRSIAPHQQPIQELSLHAFGDASGKGVSAQPRPRPSIFIIFLIFSAFSHEKTGTR
jgi:hypothetical protein